jgi:hypothetical protein
LIDDVPYIYTEGVSEMRIINTTHDALLSARRVARLGQSLFQCRERGREFSAELFARRSQTDPAAGPVEEPDSETGLEDAHGFAHARLGDPYALSCATEVQLTGEHQEDPQLAQFDVSPH